MYKRNIFHSTSLKLTAIYLSIIVFISLLFSLGLYGVSSREVVRGIRSHGPVGQVLRTRNAELLQDLVGEQDEAILGAQDRIKSNLIIINLFIFFGGGVLSYFLAKRTLRPIEQAHEAQSRFTADASHELRTPITAMRAETELTLTENKLTLQAAKNQLKSNIEELDKLTELSEGLLQLARLDNNGLDKDQVSLGHIIQQAVERVNKKAKQKSQNILVKNQSNLQIRANQAAAVEMLSVLLDNAIKYSPEKSEIKIATKSHKNSLDILVSDKGIGIRAGDIPHIFERFYRADTSRTKTIASHGYGIGLSIAQAIAELHNGKITVKSTPDKGSTFTIALPM